MSRPVATPGAATGTTSVDTPTDWRTSAACLDADPELFFADGAYVLPDRIEAAAAYCDRCPVRDACLKDAIATDVRYGIRAGRDMYRGKRPGRKQRRLDQAG